MNRSVICVHCETTVILEPRPDPVGTQLVTHLGLHRELFALDELPRWASLLEHFRVVPLRDPLIPRVLRA